MRRRVLAVVAVASAVVGPVVVAAPAQADETITTLGPLSGITITSVLNCAVNQVGDDLGEWFGTIACGTFLALGANVYGPTSIPAGFSSPTPWTPVSQSVVTGDGSTASPYSLTTVVKAGNTGVRVSEVDTYVAGQQSYRTDVTVSNTATTSKPVILSRAGDCYFSDSDSGFGRVDGGISPACVARSFDDPDVPGPRVESFVPLTAGSKYDVDLYSTVWDVVAGRHGFTNTCLCAGGADSAFDNGMGLSWSTTLAAGGSATYSHLTRFSPPPLRTTVTPDDDSVVPDSADGYAVSVANPTSQAVTVDAVVDTLPDGVTYTPGSTTGDITADPTITGPVLRWAGPWTVAPGDSLDLHLGVGVGPDVRVVTDTATAEVSAPADQTVAPGQADIEVAPVTLTGVYPAAVPVGSTMSFLVAGTTLSAGGAIRIAGGGATVTALSVASSHEVDGTLRVAATATPGARNVVYTDTEGHTATCVRCLTIDPRPAITSVTPTSIGQGAVGVTVTVNGSGFVRGGSAYLDGGEVTRRTFVSATQLRLVVDVYASTRGTRRLTVDNNDGATATANLTVTAAPRVTTAAPASVARGSAQNVTFTGSNFVTGLTVSTTTAGVTVGPPTSVTATSFVATVTVAAGAHTGKPTFDVVNPDGGRTQTRTVTVT